MKKNKGIGEVTLHGEVTEAHAYAFLRTLARLYGERHGVEVELVRKSDAAAPDKKRAVPGAEKDVI